MRVAANRPLGVALGTALGSALRSDMGSESALRSALSGSAEEIPLFYYPFHRAPAAPSRNLDASRGVHPLVFHNWTERSLQLRVEWHWQPCRRPLSEPHISPQQALAASCCLASKAQLTNRQRARQRAAPLAP
jgi:hypothetical protein